MLILVEPDWGTDFAWREGVVAVEAGLAGAVALAGGFLGVRFDVGWFRCVAGVFRAVGRWLNCRWYRS